MDDVLKSKKKKNGKEKSIDHHYHLLEKKRCFADGLELTITYEFIDRNILKGRKAR
jgi:hypothetical protein